MTTLEGEIDGRVTERVRWTLNFAAAGALADELPTEEEPSASDLGVVGQPMPLDALRAQEHAGRQRRGALRSAAGDSGASLGAEEARRRLLQRRRESLLPFVRVPMRAA